MPSCKAQRVAGALFLLLLVGQVAFAQPNKPPRNPNQPPKPGAQPPKPGAPDDNADAAAGCAACCGGSILLVGLVVLGAIAAVVLNIALLIWVARDAKSRGMDSAVVWMLLVFFTGLIGFVIYIFSRTQGDLVECDFCNNWRLEVSRACPHCGNKGWKKDGRGKKRNRRTEDDEDDEDEDEEERSRRKRSRRSDDD
jgi:uncharacterized membrane protein YhaH (DUF805 family)